MEGNLHYFFENETDENFPNNFTISISLSRVAGTLLYSVDSSGNQLIISLKDASSPTLAIEFRKQGFYISLWKLCYYYKYVYRLIQVITGGCERCRYEKFKLGIQIKDALYIQCNDVNVIILKCEFSKKFNTGKSIKNIKFNV